ncbi:MAG: hypothetical protein B6I38_00405 [Anaerolineaceae bacterium 4572_5.1]|nr:MAG: hypothetical protein B6I38_00405 [Anaerolineaceae bacterium 4572_5.1]
MQIEKQKELLALLDGSVTLQNDKIQILDADKVRANIQRLVEAAVLEETALRHTACYLIRRIALAMDVVPSSIHDLYMAHGRGDIPNDYTTPAINLRGLPFYAASAIFRIANEIDAGSFIFEIARSEIGYTEQSPAEYTANILGAAIAEGYTGPVFIQGDHFQTSPARYAKNPEKEVQAIKDLTAEAIKAGFYNIDIDSSTLVDLSKESIAEQQKLNYGIAAAISAFIRDIEPEGITVSIGGEIGEVGGHNSTEEELRAYLDGYNAELEKIMPGAAGMSKISIQTGTSHGGVVLPDGSLAEVTIDFDILHDLGVVGRESYGIGGTVQHGASTLPEDAFDKFVTAEALEVHLATNFQNIMFDHLPKEMVEEMYAYVDKHYERKPSQTIEQFHYKNRKRAIGAYKKQIWGLPEAKKQEIAQAWEKQFRNLFARLSVADTKKYVEKYITLVKTEPKPEDYFPKDVQAEDVSDLAD